MIVIDPRMTRHAAHATEMSRPPRHPHPDDLPGCSGIFSRTAEEDKEFFGSVSTASTRVRHEIDKWTPDEVERVTGLPEAQVKRIAETFARNGPRR